MDWITGISKAIDYIEEHITEPTDYTRAAKEACSSPFNFQRVFALLCGYTLGDYVCVCGGSPSPGRSCSRRTPRLSMLPSNTAMTRRSSFGLRFFCLEERRKECYTY